ncbi:hypothetical protein RRG08_053641 [Elysia crispata]|uniref:Uncharacterized protein n=1 Tax=Elysia crispata TaxID=231223 RepID=A0AAE0ZH00_9GAST|nr:hypothetical protein RRG08_053641 [Elysia crispata]
MIDEYLGLAKICFENFGDQSRAGIRRTVRGDNSEPQLSTGSDIERNQPWILAHFTPHRGDMLGRPMIHNLKETKI